MSPGRPGSCTPHHALPVLQFVVIRASASGIEPLEGGLVKGVVDVARGILALDADMHADLEQYLLEHGSLRENLWGINLYPGLARTDWLEFDSMINIRPRQGNRSRTVEDPVLQQKIRELVDSRIR
jgi:hypothetical protein